jgi:hypothetical protein
MSWRKYPSQSRENQRKIALRRRYGQSLETLTHQIVRTEERLALLYEIREEQFNDVSFLRTPAAALHPRANCR